MLEINDIIRINSNFDIIVINFHMSINDDKKSILISVIHISQIGYRSIHFIFLTKKFIIRFLDKDYANV